MLRSFTSPLKALTFLATPFKLHHTFRLLPHVSSLPVNSFAQLLSIERTTAEHSFSQIVSELELDSKTNKWVCKMRVSDFKKIKGKQPEEEEIEVFGEGDTSLEATNDAARKALDIAGVQHKKREDVQKIEEQKKD